MPSPNDEMKELREEFRERIEKEFGQKIPMKESTVSREYKEFKKEILPAHLNFYEKACNIAEKIVKIAPDPKKKPALVDAINVCHLNVSPEGTASFAIVIPLFIGIVGALLSFFFLDSFFFIIFFLVAAVIAINPLGKLPFFFANNWRLQGSNQMVLSIFYVVTYMRHTSNLELAIEFASEHLSPPLSLDFKKVLWDVETEKYDTIKESMDSYLETWRKYNPEFIDAFHLVESSLYEPSEARRVELLDKSLDVILTETYEKMLHYAHDLKNPIEMLHMLGIILPILGLVILPLVVSFLPEVSPMHIFVIYNILSPLALFYLGKLILAKRPTGYGNTDISEYNPELKKMKNMIIKLGNSSISINPIYICIFIFIVLFTIGMFPVVMHKLDCNADFIIDKGHHVKKIFSETTECDGVVSEDASFYFLEYKMSSAEEGPTVGKEIGPYGLGAALLSILIPLSFGISIGLYYRLRSKNVIEIRNNTKKLEKEFSAALFQLGNRLGDGIPAELAFGKVAEVMEDSVSGSFFKTVNANIRNLGMSVKTAIFSKESGALKYFPSNVIESSMKVLVQSIKKGPAVAAQSLMNMSRYIREIHRVDERLKDLLSETITSIKSQIRFMAPVIAGIVIGITSMISTILSKLGTALQQTKGTSAAEIGALPQIFGDGIPTLYFQLIVGIYVVQMVFILTSLANGIENGNDKLGRNYELGQNLIRSTVLFAVISFAVMLLFNLLAGRIIDATFT